MTVRSPRPSLLAHSLQILLFGPLMFEPNNPWGSLQIESLQLLLMNKNQSKHGNSTKIKCQK